jgi:hypothetical protein
MISKIIIIILIILVGLSFLSAIIAPFFFYKSVFDPVGAKKSIKYAYFITCLASFFLSVLIYLEDPSNFLTAIFCPALLIIFSSMFFLIKYQQVRISENHENKN